MFFLYETFNLTVHIGLQVEEIQQERGEKKWKAAEKQQLNETQWIYRDMKEYSINSLIQTSPQL